MKRFAGTRSSRAGLAIAALLFLSACKRTEPEPTPEPKVAPEPPPKVLYVPGNEEIEPPAKAISLCPSEMVKVGVRFCIDRYELSLKDKLSSRSLSPHYTPVSPESERRHFESFLNIAAGSRGRLGRLDVPAPPDFPLGTTLVPVAESIVGVLPQGYLSRAHVESACAEAGKRLCRRDEWITACRGQSRTQFPYGSSYEVGSCNVHRETHPAVLLHGSASLHHRDPRLGLTFDADGPLLRKTGATPSCKSVWEEDAIYDMVGNIDEWVSDERGAFLGGFFSRGTKAGCEASIDVHGPEYLDYSLGGRCCKDIEATPAAPNSSKM